MKERTEKLISRITLRLFWGVSVIAIFPICIMWMTVLFYLKTTAIAEGIIVENYVWDVMALSFVCLIFVFMILSFSAMEGFHKACCEFYHKYMKRRKPKTQTKEIMENVKRVQNLLVIGFVVGDIARFISWVKK